jgi:hypothetical protein
LAGEIREAIVFVDEPPASAAGSSAAEPQDIFAEMRPFMVDAPQVDDSRAAIYSPLEGE